jgi:Domain of unknown function (DUF4294)
MLKKLFTILFLTVSYTSFSQTKAKLLGNVGVNDTLFSAVIIVGNDTMPYAELEGVQIYAKLTAAQLSQQAKYNRLRNAVYVTYPYAYRAGALMNDINANIAKMEDRKDRKHYIKSREKELRKEFTKPLTNLSVYQGKVLMKLINRETGNNCYEIIKEYKGGFLAATYQTVAFFFDTNLKQNYRPISGDDGTIEKIVKEVQRMYGYTDNPNVKLI